MQIKTKASLLERFADNYYCYCYYYYYRTASAGPYANNMHLATDR